MGTDELKALEEKYWDGHTDLSEEKILMDMARRSTPGLSESVIALARSLHTEGLEIPDADFESKFWERVENAESKPRGVLLSMPMAMVLRYAAAAAIIIALGIVGATLLNQPAETDSAVADAHMYEDTFADPEEALNEAKNALLMLSAKFNEAQEPIGEIRRFHESKMAITGATTNTRNKDTK